MKNTCLGENTVSGGLQKIEAIPVRSSFLADVSLTRTAPAKELMGLTSDYGLIRENASLGTTLGTTTRPA